MNGYSGGGIEETDEYSENKTVIFEEKYGVKIEDFPTTEEVDKVIENKLDRILGIVDFNLLPIKKYDIDNLFKNTIKKSGQEIFYDFIHHFSK